MTKEEELQGRLNLLVKFGGVVSKETHLNKLLEIIAGQVREILSCDRCTVYLLDRHTNELWSKVAQEMQNTEIRMPFN